MGLPPRLAGDHPTSEALPNAKILWADLHLNSLTSWLPSCPHPAWSHRFRAITLPCPGVYTLPMDLVTYDWEHTTDAATHAWPRPH